MSTTLYSPDDPRHRVTVKECVAYRRRFAALGWSQNEAARRIRVDQGNFARWIRGEIASAPIRRALDATLLHAKKGD